MCGPSPGNKPGAGAVVDQVQVPAKESEASTWEGRAGGPRAEDAAWWSGTLVQAGPRGGGEPLESGFRCSGACAVQGRKTRRRQAVDAHAKGRRPRRLRRETDLPAFQRIPRAAATSSEPSPLGIRTAARPAPGL